MHIKKMLQLSWSKVNLFLQCPHCFYKEQVLKINRPEADPDCFSLNNAVDLLLKNEFDQYRKLKKAHPIMIKHNVEAIPFAHESLPYWRSYKSGGIRFCDVASGIELYGVIDDVWINSKQELIIVDYKATARQGSIVLNLSNSWNSGNKRQASYYAFLFRKSGYRVNNTGYFIYNIADNTRPSFNERLEFNTKILTYQIDDSWVEKTIKGIRSCLDKTSAPEPMVDCEFCKFNF